MGLGVFSSQLVNPLLLASAGQPLTALHSVLQATAELKSVLSSGVDEAQTSGAAAGLTTTIGQLPQWMRQGVVREWGDITPSHSQTQETLLGQIDQWVGQADWTRSEAVTLPPGYKRSPSFSRTKPQFIPCAKYTHSMPKEESLPADAPAMTLESYDLGMRLVLREALAPTNPYKVIALAAHKANGEFKAVAGRLLRDFEAKGCSAYYGCAYENDQQILQLLKSPDAPEIMIIDEMLAGRKEQTAEFREALEHYLQDDRHKVVMLTGGERPLEKELNFIHKMTANADDAFLAEDSQRLDLVFYAKPFNEQQALEYLTQSATLLSDKDKLYFARFILDRVGAYPALLADYVLPKETPDMERALEFFARRFKDEQRVKELLLGAQILTEGTRKRGGLPPLAYELMGLTRSVFTDATHELDRHGLLADPKTRLFQRQKKLLDPNRILPKVSEDPSKPAYDLSRLEEVRAAFPELDDDALRFAYEEACRARLRSEACYEKGPNFKITDHGHEVYGVAVALALKHEMGGGVSPDELELAPHYRSQTVAAAHWRGKGGPDAEKFDEQYMRHQFSKASDPYGKGRQTTAHIDEEEKNILPAQSAVGMNLGKAVGAARYMAEIPGNRPLVWAEMGDGTLASNDLHEVMTGNNLLGPEDADGIRTLPVVISVLRNDIAISTEAQHGQGIRNLKKYAESFNCGYFQADGNDFLDVYVNARRLIRDARENRAPVIFDIYNLSRQRHHSSAVQDPYDLSQYDALADFGRSLVQVGALDEADIIKRLPKAKGTGFAANHDLGRIGGAAQKRIIEIVDRVKAEPEPTLESVYDDTRAAFPKVVEPKPDGRSSEMILNGGFRAGVNVILETHDHAFVVGEDDGKLGAVFQTMAGTWERHFDKVVDGPINESLLMAAAVGYAMKKGAIALPGMQFADYVFNAFHWLLYMSRKAWMSGGKRELNIFLRLLSNPFGGGANYHSTAMEGYLQHLPGITILAPSNAWDAYGMYLTGAEYPRPKIVLEQKKINRGFQMSQFLPDDLVNDLGSQKHMEDAAKITDAVKDVAARFIGMSEQQRADFVRQVQAIITGPALPGEPQGTAERAAALNAVKTARHIPDYDPNFRVPLGKARVVRDCSKPDLSIIGWGQAVLHGVAAAELMALQGINVKVVDLRTVIPPDNKAIDEAALQSRRVLFVQDDQRSFSFAESLHSQMMRRLPDAGIRAGVAGAEDVPAVAQNEHLERATTMNTGKIVGESCRLLAT